MHLNDLRKLQWVTLKLLLEVVEQATLRVGGLHQATVENNIQGEGGQTELAISVAAYRSQPVSGTQVRC
jgi:hypothetical protein